MGFLRYASSDAKTGQTDARSIRTLPAKSIGS